MSDARDDGKGFDELLLRSDDFIKARDRKTRSSNCSQCGSGCLLRHPCLCPPTTRQDLCFGPPRAARGSSSQASVNAASAAPLSGRGRRGRGDRFGG